MKTYNSVVDVTIDFLTERGVAYIAGYVEDRAWERSDPNDFLHALGLYRRLNDSDGVERCITGLLRYEVKLPL